MESYRHFIDLFNNRELALMLWLLILAGFVGENLISTAKGMSAPLQAFKNFIKILFHSSIIFNIVLFIIYISIVIIMLYKLSLWDTSLIKDTILWISGAIVILLSNVFKTVKEENYFRKLLFDSLKFILVFEFIINIYTFPLWLEIIITPILFVVVIAQAISAGDDRLKPVNKLAEWILVLYGITLLIHAILQIMPDPHSLITWNNGKAFLMPIFLSFAYIPFLYMIALYMLYETLFIRINFFLKNNQPLAKYAKRRILLSCNFSLRRLNFISKKNMLSFSTLKNQDDVLRVLGIQEDANL